MYITQFLVSRSIDKSLLKDERHFVDYRDTQACAEAISKVVTDPSDTIRVAFTKQDGDSEEFPEKFCIVFHNALSGLPEDMIMASIGIIKDSAMSDLGVVCDYGAIGYRFSTDSTHPIISDAARCQEIGNTKDLTDMVALYGEVVRYAIGFAPFLWRCMFEGTLEDYLSEEIKIGDLH